MAMPKLLASVANGSRSVVACRARKDQKAQLLQLIRRRVPGSVCLGIGDGANDVAMLKAAHVGVGIIGKEGAQAVNNSDIAIGQFRFLRPLMFVHGRNIYRRLPVLVFYIFYKNIIETLVQYWFTTSAAWSGETPFVQLVINWYNMFYTAIPIIAFAFNDSDLPAEVAEASPAAYQIGLAARWYSHRRFWLWQLEALYFSLVVLYGPFLALSVAAAHTQDGATPGHFEVGVVVQNLIVVCATIRLALELHVITVVEVVAYVGSLIFWALNLYMFSEVNAPAGMCYECWGPWNDAATVLLSPIAMLTSLVLGAIVLTPRWASKAWNAVRGSETKEMRATAIAAVRPTRQTRGRRTKMAKPPMMRKYSSKTAGEAGFAFSVDERSARRALGFDVKRPA